MILVSNSGLVVLVLPRISNFFDIMSLVWVMCCYTIKVCFLMFRSDRLGW